MNKFYVLNGISLFLFISGTCLAGEKTIETGISDKGYYIDLFDEFYSKNKFGVGINYLPSDIFSHPKKEIEGHPLDISNWGINLNYRRYLYETSSKRNLYFQMSGDFAFTSVSSTIDLSTRKYQSGNLQFTCSSCGNLLISREQKYTFIPSVFIGSEYRMDENFNLNIALGAQYINFGSIKWETDTEFPPPSYVRSKIDEWVSRTEDYIDDFSNIVPVVKIGMTYKF